jgi:two-component system, NtrC family, nitrogen regulation response regulator NtrX
MHSILIVDDESGIRDSLKGVLEDEGYKTLAAESGEACLRVLEKQEVDLVLLDVWLPGIDGLDTLQKIRELENSPEVIMISGHGTIETAVRATKLGAYDFLEKPLSIDRTLSLIKHAIDAKTLRRENRELKRQLQSKSVIAGDSVPMKALRQQISIMAPTNGRVLIYGESGTGKELVAHAIHAQSLRKDEMFVEVNCAARSQERRRTKRVSSSGRQGGRCFLTKSGT